MMSERPDFDVGRSALGVRRFLLPLLLVAGTALGQEQTGEGPPTSLPPNYSVTVPASRPRTNWIHQSQAGADAKSSGCNQCDTGVEPMFKAAHVVLGCTD